jgi:peptidoglycan/LPS O-acetylase OafA/YrhL
MMGNASYALYLTHPFVIKGLHVAIVRGQAAAVISPILMITIAIVLSIIIATTIYHLFEQPMTRAMRYLLKV